MKAILVIDVPDGYGEITDNKATVNLKNWKLDTSLYVCNVPLKPITDVIPVEYIKEWVKRDDDFWSPNLLDYFNKLYDDWRIENE